MQFILNRAPNLQRIVSVGVLYVAKHRTLLQVFSCYICEIFQDNLRMTTSVSSDRNHLLIIKQVLRKTKGTIGHTILALFCSLYAMLSALFI